MISDLIWFAAIVVLCVMFGWATKGEPPGYG